MHRKQPFAQSFYARSVAKYAAPLIAMCVLCAPTASAIAPPTTPPDWPRAGGFGPAGHAIGLPGSGGNLMDSIVGDTSQRKWSDADLKSIIEIGSQISPRWGESLQARFDADPEEMRRALRGGGRRMAAMLILREKAPAVFEAKVAELRAAAHSQRLVEELLNARSRHANGDEIEALGAQLVAATREEVDRSLATRVAELSALEEALARFKNELDADASRKEALAQALHDRLLSAPRAPRRPAQQEAVPSAP